MTPPPPSPRALEAARALWISCMCWGSCDCLESIARAIDAGYARGVEDAANEADALKDKFQLEVVAGRDTLDFRHRDVLEGYSDGAKKVAVCIRSLLPPSAPAENAKETT
jgi:hypothetical protein